jgi:hypothetical protein
MPARLPKHLRIKRSGVRITQGALSSSSDSATCPARSATARVSCLPVSVAAPVGGAPRLAGGSERRARRWKTAPLLSSRPLPAAFAARLMRRSGHPAVRRSAPGFRSCRLVGATATCRTGHESAGTVRAQHPKVLERKGRRGGPLICHQRSLPAFLPVRWRGRGDHREAGGLAEVVAQCVAHESPSSQPLPPSGPTTSRGVPPAGSAPDLPPWRSTPPARAYRTPRW